MIDRLRVWLNRPLADSSRRGLFVGAAAVIVIAAIVLAVLSQDAPQQTATRTTTTTSAAPPPEPEHAQPESQVRPSEEGHATGLVGSRKQVEAARRAARRFLDGYLPYLYGQADASRIRPSTPELRRQLAEQAPRVPPSERRRHARVVTLQANGAGPVRAAMLALVDDGARRYTVSLELRRRSTSWQVTAAGA